MRIFPVKLGRAKFAGRKIQRRKPHAIAALRHRRQKIIFFRAKRRIRRRPRRDDPRHFPPHQLLGQPGIFHLLADGDFESLADELRDVSFSRMKRHAAHGNGHAFFLVAGGQCDLQFARRDNRVVKEKLVKIAQTEKQQGSGMVFFDGGVLPHQRRGRLGHRWDSCADYNKRNRADFSDGNH